ncbi:VWA domain-containing protein [Rhizobium sp. Root1220]|uniref:VWA domain-containing protein n=1 Tax=Rhizobium sp. Root1220 TaxID=1736432 RepID=UPI0006FDE77A|nr:VWA domain-containing protein [Rhizobium sp. Root1220]KQV80014.1 hypothetical protein ASC90_25775 [Rhizobium sp. Root1220]
MNIRSMISRMRQDESGSVLPFVAVIGIAVIGATGFGIDAARMMLLHSTLQRSIDAGALSTVAKLDTATIQAQLTKFTKANFGSGSVGATLDSLTWTISSDKKTLTVNATASAPASLMKVLGIQKISASAQSVIDRATGGIELALVLDNTGSMSGSRLTALKKASNTLLDILFDDKDSAENLYVGIVPFSQSVNVGKSHTGWLKAGSVAALDWGKTSWGGCVEAYSAVADDIFDAVPSSKPLTPYYWRDNTKNDWISDKGNKVDPLDDTIGPNKSCPAEVTRMTSDKKTLQTAIGSMKAVGNTHVNFGAVWGWRMLSPKWRGLWGGDMTTYKLPLDYNTPRMTKAVVIMTDGENTMSDNVYTAYGLLNGTNYLGTKDEETAVTGLNTRLAEVCTAMKNSGIVIYTITFGSLDKDTTDLMRGCASQNAFYFNSPTTAALQPIFKAIGNSLKSLRVSR